VPSSNLTWTTGYPELGGGKGGYSLPPYLEGNAEELLDKAMTVSFEILYYN